MKVLTTKADNRDPTQADPGRRRADRTGLRNAAAMVARGVPAEELFQGVAHEIAETLQVRTVAVTRREADGRPHVLSSIGDPSNLLEIGSVQARTNRSTVRVPIVVGESEWGTLAVQDPAGRTLGADAKETLVSFAKLIAITIGTEDAGDDLRALLRELAAMQRTARDLVGRVSTGGISREIAVEIASVLEVPEVTVCRYEPDGSVRILASSDVRFPIGLVMEREETTVGAMAMETRRCLRIDDCSALPPSRADICRELGIVSALGAPIVIAGSAWGVIWATAGEPAWFAEDAEHRIADFTEMVATYITELRAETDLKRLAEEQAALRRIATLVARQPSSSEVFDAVAVEVSRLLDGARIEVGRYESDRTVLVVGTSGGPPFAPGGRWPLDGPGAFANVLETGSIVRIEDYATARSSIGQAAVGAGFVCSIGVPIVVGGKLWGAIVAAVRSRELLPAGVERRLNDFTELVATAIANVQTRDDLRGLAEEQAALRRIATAIAEQAPPSTIFDTVAREVGRLLKTNRIDVIRFYTDGTAVIVGSTGTPAVPVGERWRPPSPGLTAAVRDGERAARIDDLTGLSSRLADLTRRQELRSGVGVPIFVEGKLWGTMMALASEPLPADTEARLGAFTQLIATAISNVQAHNDLRRLADENGALRRVATRVAQGASATDLFDVVAKEAGVLVGAADTRVCRYEEGGEITILSGHSRLPIDLPVGTRVPLDGASVTATVLRTGRPARFDGPWDHEGTIAAIARERHVSSTVGAPITVDGRIWGLVVCSWHDREEPTSGVEDKLGAFTALIGTGIANVHARDGLRRLADDQGALRRVATLVARGAQPSTIFDAVATEASKLLRVDRINIDRYRPDGTAVSVASVGTVIPPFPQPWRVEPPSIGATVRDTGRPARVDDFRRLTTRAAQIARAMGIYTAVGVPITVDGAVWGVMLALGPERLPDDIERRLTDFTELVASAISQAQARDDLITSRARIVTASDETRRRIERNLHDGVQQRLLALRLSLRALRQGFPGAPSDLVAGIDGVDGELEQLLEEIRDISRGLHPALLSRAGLGPSLRVLARRSSIPVSLQVEADPRPPEAIEIAIYYIVSEALSNAGKHSGASEISVQVAVREGFARVTILDNGVGGAVPGSGSGLVGLIDRAEAFGGRLRIESAPGAGTSISVEMPISGTGKEQIAAS